MGTLFREGRFKMNRVVLLAILVAFPFSISGQERTAAGNACFEKASSQIELNACASEAFKKADSELNLVYQQILKQYASDTGLVRRLRLAQEAWIKFRDAEMEALYPTGDTGQGSVSPMCKAMEMTRLTGERTAQLKRILDRKEGDVCPF
jgi:uncharacterized protein YecT (DUF1311 family)